MTSAAIHKRHKNLPKSHSRRIKYIAASGKTNKPTRKSVKPRFHTSIVVFVRPTRAFNNSTSRLPKIVKNTIIETIIPKIIKRGVGMS